MALAHKERAQIGGSYTRRGDEVIRDALMGHTEKGSFVIPVLVPLAADPVPVVPRQTALDDHSFSRVPAEPFERRAVRTFTQSLAAVRDLVVEPAHEPAATELHELVYRGVSREFCSALARILDESSVGEFETRVDWAPAVPGPGATPKSIVVESEAVDLVQKVADKLRQQRIDPSQVFSGTIVQLRHEEDDPFGEISVSTMRCGKMSEILVRLPLEHYTRAWDWYSAGRAVLVEGTIRRGPGRRLMVDSPERCHPIDETFLPGISAGDS